MQFPVNPLFRRNRDTLTKISRNPAVDQDLVRIRDHRKPVVASRERLGPDPLGQRDLVRKLNARHFAKAHDKERDDC